MVSFGDLYIWMVQVRTNFFGYNRLSRACEKLKKRRTPMFESVRRVKYAGGLEAKRYFCPVPEVLSGIDLIRRVVGVVPECLRVAGSRA